MQVFGYKVSNNLAMNLFYTTMRRSFRLKKDVHMLSDIGLTDEEAVFCVDRGEVERQFVEFIEQPFVDEEILQRIAASLRSFVWQFRAACITQSSAAAIFGVAALPIWALFFRPYGALALALVIAVMLLLGSQVSLDFIKDEERFGYLPKTSSYKMMIEACGTATTLIDFKLQNSATIDQLIKKHHKKAATK